MIEYLLKWPAIIPHLHRFDGSRNVSNSCWCSLLCHSCVCEQLPLRCDVKLSQYIVCCISRLMFKIDNRSVAVCEYCVAISTIRLHEHEPAASAKCTRPAREVAAKYGGNDRYKRNGLYPVRATSNVNPHARKRQSSNQLLNAW